MRNTYSYVRSEITLPTYNKIIKLNTFSNNDYLQFFEMALKLKNIQIDSITLAKEKNQDIIVNAYIHSNPNEFGDSRLLHFTYKFNDISASCIHSDFTQAESYSPFWCAFCLFKLGQDYLTIWRENNNASYDKKLTSLDNDLKYFSICKSTKEQDNEKNNYLPIIPFQIYYDKLDKKINSIESKRKEIINKKTKEELNLIKWSQNIATKLGEDAEPIFMEYENTPAITSLK